MSPLQKALSTHAVSTKAVSPSLGALLHEYRTTAGETAKTVSRRCAIGAVEIAQVELGRADLTAEQLAEAVAAYGVTRRVFPESRCRLKVDLAGGTIAVDVGEQTVEETPADQVVLTYFELMFAAGAPTNPIPFTAMDLDVLRVVLSSRRGEVTQHLQRIVGPMEEPEALTELVVPTRRYARGAVLLLTAAVTTLAGVIAVRDATSPRQPAVAPIEVHIIDAVVISRESAG